MEELGPLNSGSLRVITAVSICITGNGRLPQTAWVRELEGGPWPSGFTSPVGDSDRAEV